MFNQFLWNQSLWNQSTRKTPPTVWLIDRVEQSAAVREGDRRKYVEMAEESAEAQPSDRARARRGIN
jgi:hypothetical protein